MRKVVRLGYNISRWVNQFVNCRLQTGDDSIYRKYRYIVFHIDISYRIVSNFSIYRDIQKYFRCFPPIYFVRHENGGSRQNHEFTTCVHEFTACWTESISWSRWTRVHDPNGTQH